MNTTALRIELLTIGFQATVWVLLAFYHHLSPLIVALDPADLVTVGAFAVPATLVLLAWCYSIGAAVDGITAALGDWIPPYPSKDIHLRADSAWIRLKFPDAYAEMVRADFELRLLRSTAFNLLLIVIVAGYQGLPFGISGACLVAALLVGAAWHRRRRLIDARRETLYRVAEGLLDSSPSAV